jgi:hypothetical protein
VKHAVRWLAFGCSVISLETEDMTAAGSAYFATPLSLSRLGIPARQEKFLVLAAGHSRRYGTNGIRYLKSHALANWIAEPTHIYKKWDFSIGNSMGKRRNSRGSVIVKKKCSATSCISQLVVFFT